MDEEDDLDELLAELDEEIASGSQDVKQRRLDQPMACGTYSSNNKDEPGTSKESEYRKISKSHCILVNQKQRGNPVLKAITNVPWEFDDITPDYEVGRTAGVLFLSLRYHNLNPDYINERIKGLAKKYVLRVLLVQVDLKEPHVPLKGLTRVCILCDLTLMLAWSPEEAGKVLENYKIFEKKPPDMIMERADRDPKAQIINALSSVKPVNKTDAVTLLNKFGSLASIVNASERQLAGCVGLGARKAKTLYQAFREPFLTRNAVGESEFDEDIDLEELEKAGNEDAHS